MKLPISDRLLCCAGLVAPGARVADVGADHGYLGIYLLLQGVAQSVAACDLRPGPLQQAMENAGRYGVQERMTFYLCDGLQAVPRDTVDTVVCAGMGAEVMIHILGDAPWLREQDCRLVLQPQKDAQTLRAWLAEHGYCIEREALVQDGGFLYCAIQARPGQMRCPGPGAQFVSEALLRSGDALLGEYLRRTKHSLRKILDGMGRASAPAPRERLDYYRQALAEVEKLEEKYGEAARNS